MQAVVATYAAKKGMLKIALALIIRTELDINFII